MMKYFTLITLVFFLTACNDSYIDSNNLESNNLDTNSNDHIWKTQTDSLKKANNLAEQLNKEFDNRAKKLQNTQH